MSISREQFHEIGESKLRKYEKWIAENPEKLTREQLKDAVEWWRNELNEDHLRLEKISEDHPVTFTAGLSNIAVTSMLYGIVEFYYIKKLEGDLARKRKTRNSNRIGKKAYLYKKRV